MTFKQYVLIMIIATGFCLSSLFYVLFNINPFHTDFTGFFFFYTSFFLSFLGVCTLFFFSILHIFTYKYQTLYTNVTRSFRWSLYLILFISPFFILYGSDLLNIPILGIVILVMTLVVVLFLNLKKR